MLGIDLGIFPLIKIYHQPFPYPTISTWWKVSCATYTGLTMWESPKVIMESGAFPNKEITARMLKFWEPMSKILHASFVGSLCPGFAAVLELFGPQWTNYIVAVLNLGSVPLQISKLSTAASLSVLCLVSLTQYLGKQCLLSIDARKCWIWKSWISNWPA